MKPARPRAGVSAAAERRRFGPRAGRLDRGWVDRGRLALGRLDRGQMALGQPGEPVKLRPRADVAKWQTQRT